MAVDKKTRIERAQRAHDRNLKNAKREWAMAKNAPTDREAGPHYHSAKNYYDHVEYYKKQLDELKKS